MENERFVTYKWLIGTMLSILVICIAFIGIVSGLMNKSLDAKVNREAYNIQYVNLCNDLSQIKDVVKTNAESLSKFGRNQELVLRALKIEPVR